MEKERFWNYLKEILNSDDALKELKEIRINEDNNIYQSNLISFLLDLYDEFNNYTYKHYTEEYCVKSKIESSDIEKLLHIIGEDRIKAKLYDISWCKFKNYRHSQMAYEMYKESIKIMQNKEDESIFHILLRMFDIAVSTGKKGEQIQEVKKLVSEYSINTINDNSYLLGNLMEMFLDEKLGENDFVIKLLNFKIEALEVNRTTCVFNYLNLLERAYCLKYNIAIDKKTDNESIINVRRKKVAFLLNTIEKDEDRAIVKVDKYKNIIKILKTIPNTEEERREVFKQLEICQVESVNQMQKIEKSIDITEGINKILEDIKGKDIKSILTYYAINLGIVEKNNLMEVSGDSVLGNIFTTSIIDKKGKTRAHITPRSRNSEENQSGLEYKFTKVIGVYVSLYIIPILKYIKDEVEITDEIINKIVEKNIFVPEERKKAYIKGLKAGFEGDFITALSILIPQVENSIRMLADECGDIIYRINDDGIEELATLSSVLELPKLNESLEEDLIFNLKCIFTSKYGLNIRNEIAHGNVDDDEFNSYNAIYTWWFIYKLVIVYSPWIMFSS